MDTTLATNNPQRNVTHSLPHVDIKNHISELEVYLDNINTLRDKHPFGETKSAFNAVCHKTQDLIATMKKEVNL